MSRYYKKTSLSSLSKKINEGNEEYNPLDRLMHNSGTLQHLVKVTAWLLHWPQDCSKLQTKDRTSIKYCRGRSWIEWTEGMQHHY